MRKIIRILAAFLLIAGISAGFSGCTREKSIQIETPYGKLSYPEKYSEQFSFEQSEENGIYKVSFYGEVAGKGKRLLFDIVFGETEDYKIGSINGTDVRVASYDIDVEGFSEEEREQIYGMQEAIDYVLERLEKIKGFANPGEEVSENEEQSGIVVMAVIKTPYGEIEYPMDWNNDMKVEQAEIDGNHVFSFTGIFGEKEIRIFDLVFGETGESPVGYIIEGDSVIGVYFVPKEPDGSTELSESEIDNFYELQSRIDHIIQEIAGFENAEI